MMNERAKSLLSRLNFDECVQLFERLPSGNPMIDIKFDRMEEIDAAKFERFLDGNDFEEEIV